jgi:ketopantoate reductase
MFHLRNEHYDYCTKNGIDGEILPRIGRGISLYSANYAHVLNFLVSSYHGNFSIPAEELLAYATTEEMAKSSIDSSDHDYFDWVICSLKSTSLDDVPALIEPLLSPETRSVIYVFFDLLFR